MVIVGRNEATDDASDSIGDTKNKVMRLMIMIVVR